MKLTDAPLPAAIIYRSGPLPPEQNRIRVMVLEEGADVEALVAAFRDIEPTALEAWHRSLQPATPAPEAPAEREPAVEPQAELVAEADEDHEAEKAPKRRGKGKA